jgi:hypothetical protein
MMSTSGATIMPYAHYLAAAAYHLAHALRMDMRGLTYGAGQIVALAQRALANAIGEASR